MPRTPPPHPRRGFRCVVRPHMLPPIRPSFALLRNSERFNFNFGTTDAEIIKRQYASIRKLAEWNASEGNTVHASTASPTIRTALSAILNVLRSIQEIEAVVNDPTSSREMHKQVCDLVMSVFYMTYELNARLELSRWGIP